MAMMIQTLTSLCGQYLIMWPGYTQAQANRVGLDYFLVVNINNSPMSLSAMVCAASPDGRVNGAPLANGNTPTAGNDRKGVTAFIKSIAPMDASCHAGYTQNMKFSPAWFRRDRAKTRSSSGHLLGHRRNPGHDYLCRRGDLEAALNDPDKYPNLIVRVGGFSARFVELHQKFRPILINRTLY